MFAELTESAFGAHVIFYTHEPHFLKSGTKSLHLGGYFAFWSKLGYVFTPRRILKKLRDKFFLNSALNGINSYSTSSRSFKLFETF